MDTALEVFEVTPEFLIRPGTGSPVPVLGTEHENG